MKWRSERTGELQLPDSLSEHGLLARRAIPAAVASADSVLAVEVPARHEVPVSGALKPFLHGAFSFISDKTLARQRKNGSRAALLSFPEGAILHSLNWVLRRLSLWPRESTS